MGASQGLRHIGRLTTLTELKLASCNKITTAAVVSVLSALLKLEVLAIEACGHVQDRAAAAVAQQLSSLTALTAVMRLQVATCVYPPTHLLAMCTAHVLQQVQTLRQAMISFSGKVLLGRGLL